MANKSQGAWYVSFELRRGKRAHARATETFPNEREAKKFARAKLVDTKCQRGHAQSSSAEKDDRRNADA
jgi:predicted DNA-binding WGR domain protein